ncbi:MAG: sensor histidine kinase [Chitinophagales bacterium]
MISQQADNLFYSLFGFEKTKGRLNLFLLLLIHMMGWCFIFLLPLLFYPVKFEGRGFFLRELLSKIVLVGLFYLNYYYLLPRFFEKRKYVAYFSFVLVIIIMIIAWDVFLRHSFIQTIPLRNLPFPVHENTIWGIPQHMFMVTVNRVTSFALILLLIGGLIRLGASYMKNQHEKEVLENANLNAEINLLKSQINPHFLFNTLNSIYALAHEKSKNTEAAILKLSELLRYMLYESSEEKVELSGEILYITNYIQLQRMRLSDKIKIEYEVLGKPEGHYITPFILITFIENAFKHGVSYAKPGSINIWIRVFEKTLTLLVENPFTETDSFMDTGLGLKNAERRLELLYHGKYSLTAEKSKTRYIVNLKLDLSD